MNQTVDKDQDPEMLEEYDFSEGVRGKYAGRFVKDVDVVVLDPDLLEDFTKLE